MKIDQSKPMSGSVGESTVRTPAAKPGANRPASAESEGTSVHLGTASTQMRNLEGNVASASVVDSKKVAEIKQAISEGRFQINPSKIADGLLNTVKDLISASER